MLQRYRGRNGREGYRGQNGAKVYRGQNVKDTEYYREYRGHNATQGTECYTEMQGTK